MTPCRPARKRAKFLTGSAGGIQGARQGSPAERQVDSCGDARPPRLVASSRVRAGGAGRIHQGRLAWPPRGGENWRRRRRGVASNARGLAGLLGCISSSAGCAGLLSGGGPPPRDRQCREKKLTSSAAQTNKKKQKKKDELHCDGGAERRRTRARERNCGESAVRNAIAGEDLVQRCGCGYISRPGPGPAKQGQPASQPAPEQKTRLVASHYKTAD